MKFFGFIIVAAAFLLGACSGSAESQEASELKPQSDIKTVNQADVPGQGDVIANDYSQMTIDELQLEIKNIKEKTATLEFLMDSFTDDDARWDI